MGEVATRILSRQEFNRQRATAWLMGAVLLIAPSIVVSLLGLPWLIGLTGVVLAAAAVDLGMLFETYPRYLAKKGVGRTLPAVQMRAVIAKLVAGTGGPLTVEEEWPPIPNPDPFQEAVLSDAVQAAQEAPRKRLSGTIDLERWAVSPLRYALRIDLELLAYDGVSPDRLAQVRIALLQQAPRPEGEIASAVARLTRD